MLQAATELPPLDDEGHLTLIPEAILQERESRPRNRIINEYLITGKDASWEGEQILQHSTLQLLEDK